VSAGAVRVHRMAEFRRHLAGTQTAPVEAPGWPEPRGYPVSECLSIILNEEWEHRLYAERGLDPLAPRTS
jgi:hypothetical protein